MGAPGEEEMRREAVRVLAALRSRFRTIVPIELPPEEGCRSCRSTDREKGPFTVSLFSREVKDGVAIVTVATLCRGCQGREDARISVLDQATAVYEKRSS